MENEPLGNCPICGGDLLITRYECESCQTEIKGNFKTSLYNRLENEKRQFLEVFIRYGGNLKEIGKVLGISYPTVKSRLRALQKAWGFPIDTESHFSKASIIELLEMGEISPKEAENLLLNQ